MRFHGRVTNDQATADEADARHPKLWANGLTSQCGIWMDLPRPVSIESAGLLSHAPVHQPVAPLAAEVLSVLLCSLELLCHGRCRPHGGSEFVALGAASVSSGGAANSCTLRDRAGFDQGK